MHANRKLCAAALVLAGMLIGAGPANALPKCNPAALAGLGVAKVTIVSAVDVPASGANPELCNVLGTVRTTGFGAPDGSARFELSLPSPWNGKFLFFGSGGLAGTLSPSANPIDVLQAPAKGYATIVTDTGHVGQGLTPSDQLGAVTDARWALVAPGVPDEAKVIDYFFRATHEVAQAGKLLVQSFYQAPISRAYFDGCSNGGRMAYMEATRFPEDFDGIVAGAPFLDIRVLLAGLRFQKAQLASPNAYIPAGKLPAVDAAVRATPISRRCATKTGRSFIPGRRSAISAAATAWTSGPSASFHRLASRPTSHGAIWALVRRRSRGSSWITSSSIS